MRESLAARSENATTAAVPAAQPGSKGPVGDWVGAVVLLVAAPLLAFPEALWPRGRWALAGLAAAVGVAAVWRMSGRRLQWFAALLGAAVLAGWLKVPGEKTALSHLCGFSLGLAAMAALQVFCGTARRLTEAAAAYVALGLPALVVGLSGAAVPSPTKYLSGAYFPQLPLKLPNLEAGGLVNPNALGVTALLVLPVAAALVVVPPLMFRRTWALRVLGGATTFAAALALVATQSRSTWIALWLTALLVAARWRPLGRSRILVIAVIVAVPVAAVSWTRTRLDPTIVSAGQRIHARTDLWREGLGRVAEAPMLGIGLNHFRHISQVEPGIPHAHNMLLQTALDAGLVGLVAYVGLIAVALHSAHTATRDGPVFVRRVAAGAGLAIVGVHLFGIADAVALGAKVGLFQWWACGLALAASRVRA